MFAKLLKHEWKATSKLQGLLALGALGLGVIGAVVLKILVACFTDGVGNDLEGFIQLIFIPAMMMVVFGMIAYAYGTLILLLYRFYKNKFTDEGYLTFTLPVNSHQIFLSSGLNMLIWVAVAVVVLFVDIFVILLFGTARTGIINIEVLRGIPKFFQDLAAEDVVYLLTGGLSGIVSAVNSLVMIMTSTTIGAVLAKKHKILAAIGIYYGISTVMGIVYGVVSILTIAVLEGVAGDVILSTPYLCQMVLNIPLILGGYFLSTHLMKNKLNLP